MGGTIFSKAEFQAGKARSQSVVPIEDGLYIGSFANAAADPDEFMNHSCDSNLWMLDDVTLAARRTIKAREELTVDYALWEALDERVIPHPCQCGSDLCREWITGHDWKRPELQTRYANHFSPYLNRKIHKQTSYPYEASSYQREKASLTDHLWGRLPEMVRRRSGIFLLDFPTLA